MPQSYSAHIEPGSAGLQLLPAWMDIASEVADETHFLAAALPKLLSHELDDGGRIVFAAVVRGVKGTWRKLASVRTDQQLGTDQQLTALPESMLADVLDQFSPRTSKSDKGIWCGTPLLEEKDSDLVLVTLGPDIKQTELKSIAAALATGFVLAKKSALGKRRSERLSAMLEMTVRWNQTQETAELLQTMVETSTELLGAERATIFLLDSKVATLIGRPALGVESGEIRIPTGTGVVGQVVESSQPQRVDYDIKNEQEQIDRTVDEQLGFQTRSILCVPMFDAAGNTIGAFELLNKKEGNFSQADEEALSELAAHAAVAIGNTQQVEDLKTNQKQVADQAAEKVLLIGECQAVVDLKETIGRVAETDLAVLTLGENGTGKEVVAQLVHYLSPRRDNVLVAVNCAAISETLLESELFGHEKGAFTDAHEARQGKFELANGGTLFLDEIGDMSLSGQAKLLRVLEEKVVVRVGGSQTILTDARVIAATNQDLGQLVREKKFREDLFFRLNVVTLTLPPLRERGSDITTLAMHFLKDFCTKARRPVPKFTAAARKKLQAHSWPGNIRELRNMMERMAYLFVGEKIDAGDLSFVMTGATDNPAVPMDLPLTEATKQFQADYIHQHIKRASGNMTDAASRLGLHRSNLYRKMKQLGMEAEEE